MCTMFFQKVCFLLQISLLCIICGTYAGHSFSRDKIAKYNKMFSNPSIMVQCTRKQENTGT